VSFAAIILFVAS